MKERKLGQSRAQAGPAQGRPLGTTTATTLRLLIKGCLAVYVTVAVLATSLKLAIHPFLPPRQAQDGLVVDVDYARAEDGGSGLARARESTVIPALPRRAALADLLGEDLSSGPSQNETYVEWNRGDDVAYHRSSEQLFLSRVFADALQPSRIVPYYYRATGLLDPQDVTITTLVTANRFKVFDELVSHYRGPISVTIHVTTKAGELQEVVGLLETLYRSNAYMSQYVDTHLVIDSFDRQFNMWRNVARFFARTEYVMMLDVDFYICTDFRGRIKSDPRILDRLNRGDTALVIPAFEFNEQEDGLDVSTFPSRKQDLIRLVAEGKIDMFHNFWAPGHGSTNYSQWYDSDQIYKVYGYNHAYEPYVVFKKDGTPWCDERFIGYGANKAACLFEMYLSGVDFWVLPNDFLIHRSHPYAESTRQQERMFNKQIYNDFREEVCLRYLTWHISAGTLRTPRAAAMLVECRKSTGFAEYAKRALR